MKKIHFALIVFMLMLSGVSIRPGYAWECEENPLSSFGDFFATVGKKDAKKDEILSKRKGDRTLKCTEERTRKAAQEAKEAEEAKKAEEVKRALEDGNLSVPTGVAAGCGDNPMTNKVGDFLATLGKKAAQKDKILAKRKWDRTLECAEKTARKAAQEADKALKEMREEQIVH